MQRNALIAGLALMASGCDAGTPPAPKPKPTEAASPVPRPSAMALASSAVARKEVVDTPLYKFTFSYPAKAAAIPGLKAELDRRVAKDRAELASGSREDKDDATKNGYPYRQHESGSEWKVVADLPRWLSLSSDEYEYTGGAHGMSFFDSLLWDRQANVRRAPLDLFVSKAALTGAIREPFCAALDAERTKRRGAPVDRNSGDQFDECIDPVEHTLILGSSNGKTFDRIGILVEPYAAGAYAEGTFDITVPVTPAVLAVVKPAYRDQFSAR